MYEQRESTSELISLVWRAHSETAATYVEPAVENWGIAFTRNAGGARVATVIGPALAARTIDYRAGDSHWGVDLVAHVAWRGLDKEPLLGRMIDIPIEDDWCVIAGVRITVPGYDDLEAFVDGLHRQGLLVTDRDVSTTLDGGDAHWSGRTMQRRFRDTTGLRRKQIEQVRRAHRARDLLLDGATPAEAALEAGYSDQSHMTRALHALIGRTPARIIEER